MTSSQSRRSKKHTEKLIGQLKKNVMELIYPNTSFGYVNHNSLNYPAIQPDNPARQHLLDIRPDSRILNFSKSRISDIRLSGQIMIWCFPRFIYCFHLYCRNLIWSKFLQKVSLIYVVPDEPERQKFGYKTKGFLRNQNS